MGFWIGSSKCALNGCYQPILISWFLHNPSNILASTWLLSTQYICMMVKLMGYKVKICWWCDTFPPMCIFSNDSVLLWAKMKINIQVVTFSGILMVYKPPMHHHKSSKLYIQQKQIPSLSKWETDREKIWLKCKY